MIQVELKRVNDNYKIVPHFKTRAGVCVLL